MKKAHSTPLRTVRLLLGLIGAATLLVAGEAKADAQACVTSHASGQREVKAGRLRLATQLFTSCGSDEQCPEQVRAECTEMLESVRQTIPTVIFSVRDEDGNDVSNVQVFSTDELITKELDGRGVEMDPGKHRLRFLLPWGDVLSSDVLIREGEKNRMIEVRLEKEGAALAEGGEPKTEPAPAPVPEPSPAPPAEREPPVGAWVALGGAVVGFGAFTGLALFGNGKKQKIEDCKPNCTEYDRADYNNMKTAYLLADVGLGVGIVSATVATVLFVSAGGEEAPREGKDRGRNWATVDVATTGRDGTLLLRGQF